METNVQRTPSNPAWVVGLFACAGYALVGAGAFASVATWLMASPVLLPCWYVAGRLVAAPLDGWPDDATVRGVRHTFGLGWLLRFVAWLALALLAMVVAGAQGLSLRGWTWAVVFVVVPLPIAAALAAWFEGVRLFKASDHRLRWVRDTTVAHVLPWAFAAPGAAADEWGVALAGAVVGAFISSWVIHRSWHALEAA